MRTDKFSPSGTKNRDGWIDNVALAAFVLSAGIVWQASAMGLLPPNFWGVSAFLGLPFGVMLGFVAAVTLTNGPDRFARFWRFHVRRHGVSLHAPALLYVSLAMLGVIGVIKIIGS